MCRTATFIFLIAPGLLGCDDAFDSDREVASEEFSLEQKVADQARLVLEATNGRITVTGVAVADVVTVEGTREVHAETIEEAQQELPELRVEVEELSEEIVVRTVQPKDNDRRNFIVNYEISLPSNLAVDVTSANGNIDMVNIGGDVSVRLSNGNVEARTTLPPDGSVDIIIANGDIDLLIPVNTSASFSAVVGNGSIDVSNLELQNLVMTSKTVMGVLGEGNGAITLQTANGRITASSF